MPGLIPGIKWFIPKKTPLLWGLSVASFVLPGMKTESQQQFPEKEEISAYC